MPAFADLELPTVRKGEMQSLDEVGARKFLRAATKDHRYALWALLLLGDLRLGEALALRWEDVDLRRHSISVRRTLREIKGGTELAEPKTGRSRFITMPPGLTAAIRARKAAANARSTI